MGEGSQGLEDGEWTPGALEHSNACAEVPQPGWQCLEYPLSRIQHPHSPPSAPSQGATSAAAASAAGSARVDGGQGEGVVLVVPSLSSTCDGPGWIPALAPHLDSMCLRTSSLCSFCWQLAIWKSFEGGGQRLNSVVNVSATSLLVKPRLEMDCERAMTWP